MKKNIFLVMATCTLLLFVIISSGCTTTEEEKEEAGEKLDITTSEMYYTDYIKSESGSVSTPPESYKYFVIEVTVKNNGEKDTSVNPNYFTLEDTSTQTYTYEWESYSLPDAMTHTNVAKGSSYTSKIVFEMPNDATPSILIFESSKQKKEITITKSKIKNQYNEPPEADAGDNQNIYLGNEVSFDGTVSSDPEEGGLDFKWDFGDGDIDKYSSGTSSHKYDDVGKYTVTLTVIDDCGLEDIDTIEITIYNEPPIVDAGDDQTIFIDEEATLDGSGSSDPEGCTFDTYDFDWDYGDDTSYSGHGETTTHTYSELGLFTVTLTVSDEFGLTDEDTAEITVIHYFELTINDHGWHESTGLFDYHEGDYEVNITLKNISPDTQDVWSTFFELITSDGIGYDWGGDDGNDPDSLGSESSATWTIYFDIPEDKTPVKIIYDDVLEKSL